MADNFKILVHRTDESVHFKLVGDFDSASAYELFYAMKKDITRTRRIFIHTNSIGSVKSFDAATFQRNLAAFAANGVRLVFTGENKDRIAP